MRPLVMGARGTQELIVNLTPLATVALLTLAATACGAPGDNAPADDTSISDGTSADGAGDSSPGDGDGETTGSLVTRAEGGRVTLADEGASISIAASALATDTVITMSAVPGDADVVGPIIEIGPAGTTFDPPATVCLTVPEGEDAGALAVVRRSGPGDAWLPLAAIADPPTGQRCAATEHLSQFTLIRTGAVMIAESVGGVVTTSDGAATLYVPRNTFGKDVMVALRRSPRRDGAWSDVFSVDAGDASANPGKLKLCIRVPSGEAPVWLAVASSYSGTFGDPTSQLLDPVSPGRIGDSVCGILFNFGSDHALVPRQGKPIKAASGGLVAGPATRWTLDVPAGAVAGDVAIGGDVFVNPHLPKGEFWEIGPWQLTFTTPATLCLKLATDVHAYVVAYRAGVSERWTVLPELEPGRGGVCAEVERLGQFAVLVRPVDPFECPAPEPETFVPCGGNLAGTWTIGPSCTTWTDSTHAPCTEGETGETRTGRTAYTQWTFDGAGTYTTVSQDGVSSRTRVVSVALASCAYLGATCADLVTPLEMMECYPTNDTRCECATTELGPEVSTAGTHTGPYAIEGDTVIDFDDGRSRWNYCVEGDRAIFGLGARPDLILYRSP